MPSIQGGSPQFQPLRPIPSTTTQVSAQKTASEQGTSDHVRLSQNPSQTTQNIQRQQLLTSEATQARIQQLIKNSQPNPALERPPLSILQRSSMGSALAQILAEQHVPMPAQNLQAQIAAGQQQAVSTFRSQGPSETQDTAWQRSAGSGRRLRQEDKEAEFSMMDDAAGQGMSGQSMADDQRSGAQKQQTLLAYKRRLEQEQDEHAAFVQKPKQKLPPVPPRNSFDTRPAKAELKKPEIKKSQPKPSHIQPPAKSPGKKPKADEWDL